MIEASTKVKGVKSLMTLGLVKTFSHVAEVTEQHATELTDQQPHVSPPLVPMSQPTIGAHEFSGYLIGRIWWVGVLSTETLTSED